MSIEKERHWLRNTALAGIGLSAVLHGYIEMATTDGHGPRVEASGLNPWAPTSTESFDEGFELAGLPYGGTEVVGVVSEPGEAVEQSEQKVALTGAAYARQFDMDDRARDVDEKPLADLEETIRRYQTDGWQVTVEVTGLASAEDATADDNDGTQAPSNDNIRLANVRAQATVDTLIKSGIDPSIIVMMPGREDSWTDSQLADVQKLADKYGYGTVERLNAAYNADPSSVPPEVRPILYERLDNNRGSEMVLRAKKLTAGPGSSTPIEKEVCFLPVLNVTREVTTANPWSATIPYGIFVTAGTLALASGVVAGRKFRVYSKPYIPAVSSSKAAPPFNYDLVAGRGLGPSINRPNAGRLHGDAGGGGLSTESPLTTVEQPVPAFEPNESDIPEEAEGSTGEIPAAKIAEHVPEQPINPEPRPEKSRRKWPLLIPPVVIVGAGLLLATCRGDTEPPVQAQPGEVCNGLEPKIKVVGTRTIVVEHGYETDSRIAHDQ